MITKGGHEPSPNLFIAGLPREVTEDTVRAVFSQYGAVETVKVLPDSGRNDRASLVKMCDINQAAWVVSNLNNNIPQGMAGPVTVRFADNRAEKAKALGIPKGDGKGQVMQAGVLAQMRASPYGAAPVATGLDYSQYGMAGMMMAQQPADPQFMQQFMQMQQPAQMAVGQMDMGAMMGMGTMGVAAGGADFNSFMQFGAPAAPQVAASIGQVNLGVDQNLANLLGQNAVGAGYMGMAGGTTAVFDPSQFQQFSQAMPAAQPQAALPAPQPPA